MLWGQSWSPLHLQNVAPWCLILQHEGIVVLDHCATLQLTSAAFQYCDTWIIARPWSLFLLHLGNVVGHGGTQPTAEVVGPVEQFTVGPLKVTQGSNAGKAIIFHWANTYGTCLEQI